MAVSSRAVFFIFVRRSAVVLQRRSGRSYEVGQKKGRSRTEPKTFPGKDFGRGSKETRGDPEAPVSNGYSSIMLSVAKNFFKAKRDRIPWEGSVLAVETTLHQLSPYVGKMKSSMARSLVEQFTQQGDVIYDPFCGSGSVALESWINRRAVIATDLNPYAVLLTRAKLAPPPSVDKALEAIEKANAEVHSIMPYIKLGSCPSWVRSFFHPKTLREILHGVRFFKQIHRSSYCLVY